MEATKTQPHRKLFNRKLQFDKKLTNTRMGPESMVLVKSLLKSVGKVPVQES